MITWTEEPFRFEYCAALVNSILNRDRHLPFAFPKETFAGIAVFERGRLFTDGFFSCLRCVAGKVHTNSIFVMATDPDPQNYFRRNYGRFPLLEFSMTTNDELFRNSLHWDPDGGGADSIATRADALVIFDDSSSWALFWERDFDLIRVIVQHSIVERHIEACFPVEFLLESQDIFYHLINSGVSDDLATQFIASNRVSL